MKFMLVESITEKIDRLHYKESDKPFYDAIRDILQYQWKDELFETFYNSEYLYQTPVPKLIGDDRISLSDLTSLSKKSVDFSHQMNCIN